MLPKQLERESGHGLVALDGMDGVRERESEKA